MCKAESQKANACAYAKQAVSNIMPEKKGKVKWELKVDKLSLYSKIIGIMRLRKDMVKKWLKYTITEK